MKKFALAGNPNSGKTTLFNSLTGSTAHVGNWPGVTVDKREGTYRKSDESVYIVDLPGIYSLSPYTPEEVVSRNFIIDEKPDCVINIIDATNLERNLYLTTQLLEIDVPIVVALNMSDVVRKNGDEIDASTLSKRLGVPVVEISALKEEHLDELMQEAIKASNSPRKGITVIQNKNLLHLINDVNIAFELKNIENPLFHAIKLVELDELEMKMHPETVETVNKFKATFENDIFGNDFEALIADSRYEYITKNYATTLKKNKKSKDGSEKLTKSDKIDKVMTHKIWAIPIFVFIMFLVFHLTFSEDLFFLNGLFHLELNNEVAVNIFSGMAYDGQALQGIPSPGVLLQNWMGFLTGKLIDIFRSFMPVGTWYTSLVCDGILTGLDAVLSFIPQVMILFLFIAILEDSGYMSRVAFILDRAFRKFGLSGKAFIPMLTGFGCSVPAIMATRTLEDEREKNRTIRLMTCFSCGAKAPIWALLAATGVMAGFAGDLFVFAIYLGGIACAIIFALFMKLFSKDRYVSPFIMELPAYHMPQAKNVAAHLWDKLKHYLIKASTIIAACTIVVWFLSNFGWDFWHNNAFNSAFDPNDIASYTFKLGNSTQYYLTEITNKDGVVSTIYNMKWSILGTLGQGLRYIFYPLGALEGGWAHGADAWKYSVSIITGLVAKEDVVATMVQLGLNEETIGLSIAGVYSFAFYNLFTLPCFAAIGAARAEQKGKEFWLTILWWLAMSYGFTLIVYWLGSLFSVVWWAGVLVALVLIGIVVGVGITIDRRNKSNKERIKE